MTDDLADVMAEDVVRGGSKTRPHTFEERVSVRQRRVQMFHVDSRIDVPFQWVGPSDD